MQEETVFHVPSLLGLSLAGLAFFTPYSKVIHYGSVSSAYAHPVCCPGPVMTRCAMRAASGAAGGSGRSAPRRVAVDSGSVRGSYFPSPWEASLSATRFFHGFSRERTAWRVFAATTGPRWEVFGGWQTGRFAGRAFEVGAFPASSVPFTADCWTRSAPAQVMRRPCRRWSLVP